MLSRVSKDRVNAKRLMQKEELGAYRRTRTDDHAWW